METYAADRGYDDTENHYLLESLGLHSAIRLKHTRTGKRDGNKEVWEALQATPQYQAGQKERYKIERKYGEAKEYHKLRRCRYVGWLRCTLQAYLTALVLNLQAAGALADRCAVSRACYRGCLTQGGVCLEEEKGGWKGHPEVKRWADDTGWGGLSGLNETRERAAKAASHF